MNPFSLGTVYSENDFCNRKTETDDLLRFFRGGQNVVLYSPRRYGKTSLAKRVLNVLGEEGFLVAYVDLFPILSEGDFIKRFAEGIFKGIGADPNTLLNKLGNLFRRLVPNFEVGPDGYKVSVTLGDRKDSMLLDDVMDNLYAYVAKHDLRGCIVLDEFQEITELPESKRIEGVLRSHIQNEKSVSYLYVGSRRRILQDMFSNKSRPFYKSSFSYTLEKIGKEDYVPFIVGKFDATGKICPHEIAEEIYDAVQGYPCYVQKLASLVWDVTSGRCDSDTVREAFRTLLWTETGDFEGIWSGLTLTQRSMLKALASESTSKPYSRGFLDEYRLSLGGAQGAIKVLLSRDLIEQDREGLYRLTDPVMARWMKEI